MTSITGTEEQRAALPQTTPEKERDAFVIAPRWRGFGRQSNANVWDWASLLLSSLEVAGNDLTFKPFFQKTKSFKKWSMLNHLSTEVQLVMQLQPAGLPIYSNSTYRHCKYPLQFRKLESLKGCIQKTPLCRCHLYTWHIIINMSAFCRCTTLDIPKWGLLRGGHFWGQLGLAFVGGRTLDSSHHWFSRRPAPWTVQVRSISIGTRKTRGIRLQNHVKDAFSFFVKFLNQMLIHVFQGSSNFHNQS